MPDTASEHAWTALGELQAIDEDDVPSDLHLLLDETIEKVEDLAVELGDDEDGPPP